MAAGRFDVSRKRDFHHSKKESHRHRNGYHEVELSRGRGQSVGYDSYSTRSLGGRSDDGRRQGRGFVGRTGDQEPRELLGGGRSGYVFSFQSQSGNNEISKFEDGGPMPAGKRRKFSPVVWDRDEKEVRISSKNRIATTTPLRSPPSLPKSEEKVPNVVLDEDVRICPVTATQLQSLQILPVEPMGTGGSKALADSPASLPSEQCGSNDREPGHMVEEEYFEARNISTSRWAYQENSPGEICVSDDEDMSTKGKVVHHVDSSKMVSATDMLSPESGEFRREGFEGSREKSSGSDGEGRFVGPASGDEYTENEVDANDFMEIDVKHVEVAAVSQLDSDTEDDDDSCGIQEPAFPKHRSINMLQGCRSVFEYEKLNKINEGTYGVVYRARDKKTGQFVALKKVKIGVERNGGFPMSSLREINILLSFHHPSIVDVKEVVMGDLDSVFMVMEYMEHDLKELMHVMKNPFGQSEVKCLMLQLLEGVRYLHDNWVLHRDLKTSNLLLNNRGELKICDFGLSRQYGSPMKPYTTLVVTLWYRAPELLLGTKKYSTAIDMWSVGCIMAELLAKEPLFNGKTEFEQLDKIFRTLGTPNETIWPGFSEMPGVKVNFVKQPYNLLRKKFPAPSFTGSPFLSDLGFDLLSKLLTYDPEKRITAEAALNHGWFHEVPLPKSKEFMPTFPSQHAHDRHLRRIVKSPDPLKEQQHRKEQG
uniref:cyclin-dependent kinase n=1 Tax=Davidia involucrata TaxID=16924 RepID=A0A5B7C2U0_DAVIN